MCRARSRVVVTPRPSLVGKKPSLMACMCNSDRISARLFALNDSRSVLFTYLVDDVRVWICAWNYNCINEHVYRRKWSRTRTRMFLYFGRITFAVREQEVVWCVRFVVCLNTFWSMWCVLVFEYMWLRWFIYVSRGWFVDGINRLLKYFVIKQCVSRGKSNKT